MEYRFKNFNSGFTFIELVIVLSIFAILTGITMFNFTDFNSNVSLRNLVHEVAMQINQAQNEAISGRYNSAGFVGDEAPSYGVYFNIATPNQFIYFADLNKDGIYNNSSVFDCGYLGEECLNEININTGDTVTGLCSELSCDSILELNITFTRPFPDAVMKETATDDFSNAKITVSGAKRGTKSIKISSLGQISVH